MSQLFVRTSILTDNFSLISSFKTVFIRRDFFEGINVHIYYLLGCYSVWSDNLSWRWRQQAPPKRQYLSNSHTNDLLSLAVRNYFIGTIWSRYSVRLWAGWPRVRSSNSGRVKNFLFRTASRAALWPTHPPMQWVRIALSPGIKREGNEADHSPSGSAEIKKTSIYTSTLHTSSWRSA
jgi:hypothetical protein